MRSGGREVAKWKAVAFDEKKMGSTQKDALKKFSIPVGA